MKRKSMMVILLLFVFANVVHASVNGTFKGYEIIKIYSNGEELTAENPAILFEGTTMVPIRMIEDLGFAVDWDAETYSVDITPPEPVIITQEPAQEPMAVEPTTEATTTEETTETEPLTGEEPTEPTPTPDPTASPSPTPSPTPEPSATPEPTPTPTPEPSVEPSPTPEPDNTAMCQKIKDDYAGQIALLPYQGFKTKGKMEYAKLLLEYERDQELAANGCN